jgi:hypothetical protein
MQRNAIRSNMDAILTLVVEYANTGDVPNLAMCSPILHYIASRRLAFVRHKALMNATLRKIETRLYDPAHYEHERIWSRITQCNCPKQYQIYSIRGHRDTQQRHDHTSNQVVGWWGSHCVHTPHRCYPPGRTLGTMIHDSRWSSKRNTSNDVQRVVHFVYLSGGAGMVLFDCLVSTECIRNYYDGPLVLFCDCLNANCPHLRRA